MTIQEAIARVDALKPNAYTPAEKIVWLNNIDMTIKAEVLDTHEGWEAYADFSGYTTDTDQDTDLLVGSPYDKLYEHWLEAQIDYTDGETDRYQNSMAMFMTAYSDYARWYNRNHAPCGGPFKYV